jgi:hypothetical protein
MSDWKSHFEWNRDCCGILEVRDRNNPENIKVKGSLTKAIVEFVNTEDTRNASA